MVATPEKISNEPPQTDKDAQSYGKQPTKPILLPWLPLLYERVGLGLLGCPFSHLGKSSLKVWEADRLSIENSGFRTPKPARIRTPHQSLVNLSVRPISEGPANQ